MWDEGDVGNAADLVTTGIQRTYGGLTTRARALHINVEVFQTIFQCSLASTLGCNLCSKGSAFPRTAETGATGSRPAQSIALTVGDGDDGVVEGRMDVGDPINHRLFYFRSEERRVGKECRFRCAL